jgi:mono/diheme cytochrome c family protein
MKNRQVKLNHLLQRLFAFSMILGLLLVLPMCTNNTANKTDEASGEETEATTAMTPVEEGAALFLSYCVLCHGRDGKGEGALVDKLKQMPPDLTTIAQRRGTFDRELMHKIVAGVEDVPGHSTGDMPAWFETFKTSEKITDEKVLDEKIGHIVAYMETIQVDGATEE